MKLVSRRSALLGLVSGAAALVAGCSPGPVQQGPDAGVDETESPQVSPEPMPDVHRVVVRSPMQETVIPDGVAGLLPLSRAVLETATAVVVVAFPAEPEPEPEPSASPSTEPSATPTPSADPTSGAVTLAESLGLPVLLADTDLLAELNRLQTRTVIIFGDSRPDVGDREVITPADAVDLTGLPLTPEPLDVVALTLPEAPAPAPVVATLAAAGIEVLTLDHPDPRATGETVATVKGAAGVLGIGAGFGDGARFATRLEAARTLPELPGGGVLPYPGRMMVALYGHPSGPTLGLLGEQGPQGSVDRVKRYVEQYQQFTDKPVIGCFEIITTVASAAPGRDGNYSNRTPIEQLRPLIDIAAENDIYCVLDLQPGYNTFLSQAKIYEELLLEPHVGLALDPEWRIVPPQRHMTIIGQVHADEINETGAWLAQLVRDNQLPPKVLVLHQFQTRMIVERDKVDTSHEEIQYLMHADGHGTHGQKLETWRALRVGLSEDIWLGWKNFIDEDVPMMTVEQTMSMVSPAPDFVSYQ